MDVDMWDGCPESRRDETRQREREEWREDKSSDEDEDEAGSRRYAVSSENLEVAATGLMQSEAIFGTLAIIIDFRAGIRLDGD